MTTRTKNGGGSMTFDAFGSVIESGIIALIGIVGALALVVKIFADTGRDNFPKEGLLEEEPTLGDVIRDFFEAIEDANERMDDLMDAFDDDRGWEEWKDPMTHFTDWED